ncbi:LOW QUALITY PROTEIN: hypothetical protein ACHAWF_004242, partial [Thalassiosira exigua]
SEDEPPLASIPRSASTSSSPPASPVDVMSRATDAAVGNGAYFTSRREVLSFLNDLLDLDLTKIEQTASGAVACQLTEYLFPGSVPMGKVNWAAKSSFEHLHNYKLLQRAFNKHKIRKHVDTNRLSPRSLDPPASPVDEMSRATDAAVAYFTSRRDVQSFLNDLLDLNLTKIEQTVSGAVACQLTDYLFTGSVPMSKVKWSAKSSFEYVHNYKLLQRAFNKHKIRKHVDVGKLIRGKLRDKLEFCQWLVAFCKRTAPVPAEARYGYNPVAAHAKEKGGKDVMRRYRTRKATLRAAGSVGGGPGGGKRAAPARTESAAGVLSLPDAALSHAASPRPRRRRRGAADASVICGRQPQTILGAGAWDELDFRDVGRDPASRLSDDDVGAALACVDAANGLKTLKLRGCAKVVGECLRLLQGSTVLEHIDLRVGGLSRK